MKEMYVGNRADKKFNWLNQLYTLVNKQFIWK